MEGYSRRLGRGMAVAAILMLGLGTPALAQTLMSEDQVRAAIAEKYGVEVLRIEAADIDGKPAFILRVMNPQGNFNEAFQVHMLAVDRSSGELIPQFRHKPAGYDLSGGADTGSVQ